MRFKKELAARDLTLHPDGVYPLVLHVSGPHEVTVTMTTDEDISGGLSCIAETTFEPSQGVKEAFERLSIRRLPDGHVPREKWPVDLDYIDDQGNFGDYQVPLWLMPQGFQSLASHVDGELGTAIRTTLGVLRWRSRTLGSRSPFASRGTQWTLDGTDWHPLPQTTQVEILTADRLELTSEAVEQMQALLMANASEPLAHELFREAWSQHAANPRSSMLLAMTALEVGIKQYISACVPDARWLAEVLRRRPWSPYCATTCRPSSLPAAPQSLLLRRMSWP